MGLAGPCLVMSAVHKVGCCSRVLSNALGTVDVLKAWLTPFPPWESMSNAVTYKTVCEHVQQSV